MIKRAYRKSGRDRKPVQCSICGRQGHNARSCPKEFRDKYGVLLRPGMLFADCSFDVWLVVEQHSTQKGSQDRSDHMVAVLMDDPSMYRPGHGPMPQWSIDRLGTRRMHWLADMHKFEVMDLTKLKELYNRILTLRSSRGETYPKMQEQVNNL